MAQWADASQTVPMHPSSLDMDMRDFDPEYDPTYDLEARCPMCRTPTTAQADLALTQSLEAKYPNSYAERRAEEVTARATTNSEGVENVVILIGNRHKLVGVGDEPGNKHDWTFFVRLSRPELVSHVKVNLHPTFRPPSVVLRDPPFEVRRLGWGYFSISATIVLKEGWEWIGGGEVRGELSDRKGALELGWMLDFDGDGRQGRIRAGVRRVGGYADEAADSGVESPLREPSPVEDGSPVRDVSPVRWPHMDNED
ncbi:uncharacterized protein N0V89_005938 [Didymosphaeria variabile]|uniref:Protein AF-9 homolog n=1 Tax=Didymosphaeria variabile TaxID=1932322 RepID=A0A9W9CBY7_9PLEO|nr:uncharacterized protein N0V89_005938 [Didymosphaeria variabile]KAJ4354204.1 hypothetical protein N0V89_005938 [Didymosphaeria variabile]